MFKFQKHDLIQWKVCDQLKGTFKDGCDESGQQTASINGQVEDGEEGASLLLLQDINNTTYLIYIGCFPQKIQADNLVLAQSLMLRCNLCGLEHTGGPAGY